MKNIIVTGGCGFIGSNFLNYMVPKYKDYNFINLDCLNYCSDVKNVKSFENYKFIECNITNLDMVKFVFQKYQPEVIFHFAAQSHVDGSFEDPLRYLEDNTKGTTVLLESLRILKLKTLFFHISTDEVYGESSDIEMLENSILLPTNPYAATKAAAEMLLHSYGKSFKQEYKIIRGNNVYGPNQFKEKLIPKFIDLLKKDKKCTIHGKGEMKRSFVHTYDFSTAVELIWLKGETKQIYNIGSSEEFTVLEITKKLIKLIKKTEDYEKYILFVKDRNFNDSRYLIGCDKLKRLGWKQTINFEKGISELVKDKFLVYGSKGWIGNIFCQEISKENICFQGKERCENYEKVRDEILKVRPNYVICSIGRTYGGNYNNIDYLEDNPELNQRDNFDAPKNLMDICEELNIKCLYLGTGCIFEYDDNHTIGNGVGFTEEDSPNFFGSAYSRKKGELDLLTRQYKNTLNCRIRMPITKDSNPRNFVDKIKSFEKICSIPNSVTYLDEAVPEMLRILKEGKTGTVNVVNPGVISHSEILDSLGCEYKLITIEELEKKCVKARRSNNYLVTSDCLNLTPIKDIFK